MQTEPQNTPEIEPVFTIEGIVKQVEASGINLGDNPKDRIKTFMEAGLVPKPLNGRFPSWVVQRIIAIEDEILEGKSLTELKEAVRKERKHFLHQVTDLNSMVSLYRKFSSNSLFSLVTFLLLALVVSGFIGISALGPSNPIVVAGQSLVKAALEAGGNMAKTAASPVGRTLVTIIKTAKPEDSDSADPLQLTNLEIESPVIPENLVQLDEFGNLVISGLVEAVGFLGSGENLTSLPASEVIGELNFATILWSSIRERPKVLSSIDGVSNDEGNIDLVAGAGLTIFSDEVANTITFTSTDTGSIQAIFKNLAVSGKPTIVADSNIDTLTFAAGANITLTPNAATDTLTIAASASGVTDHGSLTGLLDDDHTQYAILTGRVSGQTLIGGTGASDRLVLQARSGTTTQVVIQDDVFGTGIYLKGGIIGAIGELGGGYLSAISLPNPDSGLRVGQLLGADRWNVTGLLRGELGLEVYDLFSAFRFRVTQISPHVEVFGDFEVTGTITAGSATSTHTLNGMLCVRNATACPAQAAGRLYVDTAGTAGDDPGDVFDIAEIYDSTQPVDQGEVVSAAGNKKVKKASSPYDPAILGVTSTHPAALIEDGAFYVGTEANRYNPNQPWVALAGRVPTKVSAENGSISPGDPLTSSSTAGVAMKATESGPIIGKALEAYGGIDVSKIMVFVSTGWYVAPLTSSDDLVTSLANITDLDVETLIAATIKAEKIFTDELVVSSKTSGNNQVKSGQNSLTVENNRIKSSSKILVTFTSDYSPANRFWVTKKEGESFTVHFDQPVAKDSTFDWFLIN